MTKAERERLFAVLDRIHAKLDEYADVNHPIVNDIRVVMSLAINGERVRVLTEEVNAR